jgi:hypothetical protein
MRYATGHLGLLELGFFGLSLGIRRRSRGRGRGFGRGRGGGRGRGFGSDRSGFGRGRSGGGRGRSGGGLGSGQRLLQPYRHEAQHLVGDLENPRDLIQSSRLRLEVQDEIEAVPGIVDLVRKTPLAPFIDLHEDASVTRDDLLDAVEDRCSFLFLGVGAKDQNQLIAVQFGSPPTV